MKSSLEIFLELLDSNRKGLNKGIYSVCTAHPDVLEASFKQAKRDNSLILIESTSNQVDQYGGYTGMKPIDFVNFVNGIADKVNFPKEMILLGGDHLGPNPWKSLPAKEMHSYTSNNIIPQWNINASHFLLCNMEFLHNFHCTKLRNPCQPPKLRSICCVKHKSEDGIISPNPIS